MTSHSYSFSPIPYESLNYLFFQSCSEYILLYLQCEEYLWSLQKCSNGVIQKRNKWVFLKIVSRSIAHIIKFLPFHVRKIMLNNLENTLISRIRFFGDFVYLQTSLILQILLWSCTLISHKQVMYENQFTSFKSFAIYTLH